MVAVVIFSVWSVAARAPRPPTRAACSQYPPQCVVEGGWVRQQFSSNVCGPLSRQKFQEIAPRAVCSL